MNKKCSETGNKTGALRSSAGILASVVLIVFTSELSAQEPGLSGARLVRSAPTVRASERPDARVLVAPLGPSLGATSPQRTIVLPAFSPALLEALRQDDAASGHQRVRIGLSRAFDEWVVVDRNTVLASQWITLANGWRVFSIQILSSGALGVRLHVESPTLPEGARLVAYDPREPARERAAITAQEIAEKSDIWTGSVFAENIVLECQVPPGVDLSTVAFTVSEVSHQYRSVALSPQPRAASCELDATCYPAWSEQEAAVARIQFIDSGQEYLCSGCLLNYNNTNSTANYFLTANHCVHNQQIASTVQFFWLYQTTTCNNPNTAPDINTMPFTSGSTLLATAPAATGNDFTFLLLPQSPPSGTVYAGWTTALPSTNDTLTVLHHPGLPPGDYTHISFGNETGTGNLDAIINGSSSGPDNAWQVQWSSGVTEDGSSGSPLFDTNHAVIGQLYGGTSSCDNQTGSDIFGRFDVTYQTVRKWLDPLSSGTFAGLFYDTNGATVGNSGSVNITITPKGGYSGKLQMGSSRFSFSGQFDKQGTSSATTTGAGANSLTVTLNFTSGTDQLTGTVSNNAWMAELAASAAVFNAKTNPASFSPKYTLVLPGSTNGGALPQGGGFAAVSVKTSGQVSLSGNLADGTSFSQSATVLEGGQWPLYVPLYHNQGLILGWLTFGTNPPPGGLSGALTWIKPAMSSAKVYPAGFTNNAIMAIGSSYAKTTPLVNLTNGSVSFSGGNLGSPFTNSVSLSANNHVVNGSGNKLTLNFVPSTGLFSGSVAVPTGTQSLSFHGALLQNSNVGYGYFLGGGLSGSVFLGSN